MHSSAATSACRAGTVGPQRWRTMLFPAAELRADLLRTCRRSAESGSTCTLGATWCMTLLFDNQAVDRAVTCQIVLLSSESDDLPMKYLMPVRVDIDARLWRATRWTITG
ncbi:hypothetical protein Ahu01nite_094490 [Winogradskya humida]|uniref:Uncharacterized protein n=1 Tax=Winogradskya humida TaxID=113566 RepID=A0ABQ4A7Q0_9ACTN|nr:hypothetical protein Ahu01nite_094490 [Actinoplanes humidus]